MAYIDYDDMLKKWHDLGLDEISRIHKVNAFNHFIKSLPTADVVEVKHGEWICEYDKEMGETDVTCSVCKDRRTINGCYVSTKNESLYTEDNYCPNCGAKMDGRSDE